MRPAPTRAVLAAARRLHAAGAGHECEEWLNGACCRVCGEVWPTRAEDTMSDYLETADVWTILDLIVAEWSSDPQAVQCFDLRLVQRGKALLRERAQQIADVRAADSADQSQPVRVELTASELLALRDLVARDLQLPDVPTLFVDIARGGIETTPEQLLLRLVLHEPGAS